MGILQKSTYNIIQRRSDIISVSLQNTDLISHFSHPF
ncbi:protein usd [Bacillus atrophaeus]|nr:protein usd [Bacillus atrophaeus]